MNPKNTLNRWALAVAIGSGLVFTQTSQTRAQEAANVGGTGSATLADQETRIGTTTDGITPMPGQPESDSVAMDVDASGRDGTDGLDDGPADDDPYPVQPSTAPFRTLVGFLNSLSVVPYKGADKDYNIGVKQTICFKVPNATRLRIQIVTPAGTTTIATGEDDGAGDCIRNTVPGPSGKHTIRIELLDASWQPTGVSAESNYFAIVPGAPSNPPANPGTPPGLPGNPPSVPGNPGGNPFDVCTAQMVTKSYEKSMILGPATSSILSLADGVGKVQVFLYGRIYCSPNTGAHEIHGPILNSYLNYGGERNLMFGYPTTDVTDGYMNWRLVEYTRFQSNYVIYRYK